MTIAEETLRPGDVLLYRGEGLISWAIRLFDNSEVNHAGLYLGQATVGEALPQGLARQGLAQSVEGSQIWVRRLSSRPETMEPVLEKARDYLDQGRRYAYEQIIMLALLSIARNIPQAPIVADLVDGLLRKGLALLARLVAGQREPMICSEFVFRCHDEADPALEDPYVIEVAQRRQVGPAQLMGARGLGLKAPTPAGGGAHPRSLLALAQAAPAHSWLTKGVSPARFLGDEPEPTDAELDQLLGQYQRQLGQDPDAALREARPTVTFADLDGIMHKFGDRLRRAVDPAHAPARGMPRTSALAWLDQYAQANFVTPGDLLKSPSLFTAARHPG